MRTSIFCLIIAFALPNWLFAQDSSAVVTPELPTEPARVWVKPQVRQETVEYNGVRHPAYAVDIDAAPSLVERGIKDYFMKFGYKPDEKKGFIIYKSIIVADAGISSPKDIYFSIERKSKKEREASYIHFIVVEPNTLTDTKLSKDEKAAGSNIVLAAGGAALLDGFSAYVDQQIYLKAVEDQKSAVEKNEKRLRSLESDKGDMEKKLQKLTDDLKRNADELTFQKEALRKSKLLLDAKIINKPPSYKGN